MITVIVLLDMFGLCIHICPNLCYLFTFLSRFTLVDLVYAC